MTKRLPFRAGPRVRRIGAVMALLATAIVGAVATAAPASAHHNNPQKVCGGVNEYAWVLSAKVYNGSGKGIGYLALQRYRHHKSDTFCAVNIRRWHGERRYTMVEIKRCARGVGPGDRCRGDAGWHRDEGRFHNYAGPVYRGKSGGTIVAKAKIRHGWVTVWFHGPDRCQARWSAGHPGSDDSSTCRQSGSLFRASGDAGASRTEVPRR